MSSASAQVNYALLTNGLDFIESAVGNLSGSPTQHELKYATLHLAAGIELVLKERLLREHWTLVFSRPEQASRENYKVGKFQSVTVDDCIKRLANIGGVIITQDHQNRLSDLRDKRNRLEHFGIVESAEAFKASTAQALSIIIDFIDSYLVVGLFNTEDAGRLNNVREQLREFKQFIAERWKVIKTSVGELAFPLTCPCCGQKALSVDESVRCLFCGYSDEPQDALKRFVSEVVGQSLKDIASGESVVSICPECELESLVDCGRDGNTDSNRFICFNCRSIWKDDELDSCPRCGLFYHESDGQGVCHICWADIMSKD